MKRKKIVRKRGSKTHGYGSKKKHRGAGSRGGRGMAGSAKHMKFRIMKTDPEHFGKRGFKTLACRKITASKPKAMNLRDIERLAGGNKEFDAGKAGFEKILGSGAPKKPMTIKAHAFSDKAKQKIEESGGKALAIEE